MPASGGIEFHEVLGFWDFYGILGLKVKMNDFEQGKVLNVVIFVESVVHRSNWRSRLSQFLWNASWTCGPLIQQKSQHSTLFLTPFCAQVARNDAF